MSQSKRLKKESCTCCSTCGRILTAERYVRCIRCPNFTQCLQCLSIGFESEIHLRTHNFFVIEPKPSPVYCQDWDGHDEILLLFGVKIYGIGNWNDIANFMKSKTAVDCETHYITVYVESNLAPFPDNQIIPPIPRPPPPAYDTRPVESCPSVAHEKHMQEKNKKEKTIPAEYSGYMPYRHEFEVDWNNDAEILVAKIEFKATEESTLSFQEKLNLLISYNNQLAERKFRTKVIEDWDIQNKEVKPTNRGDKDDPRILGGLTDAERYVDSKILSLAPYYGVEKMQKLSSSLHKRFRYIELIQKLMLWNNNGVRSHVEGNLFTNLLKCMKDGKIPASEVDNWNEMVSEFQKSNGKMAIKNDEYLALNEAKFCNIEKIHPQAYLAMKGLMMREYACRGTLSRNAAMRMDPMNEKDIGKVYDLLKSLGMIL